MKTKIEIRDGFKKEYIKYKNSKQWEALYTLDSGKKITIAKLCKKLRCTTPCARSRLNKHSDDKVIFSPVTTSRRKPNGFVAREFLLNPNTWYKDPLVKLMLK